MAWRFDREANTLWPGATPEARRDFGAILASKYGVAPGHKTFFPASALLLAFMALFLNFQVFVRYWKWNWERNHWWNEHFQRWFHFRACSC
jgi:hypothetical protein